MPSGPKRTSEILTAASERTYTKYSLSGFVCARSSDGNKTTRSSAENMNLIAGDSTPFCDATRRGGGKYNTQTMAPAAALLLANVEGDTIRGEDSNRFCRSKTTIPSSAACSRPIPTQGRPRSAAPTKPQAEC